MKSRDHKPYWYRIEELPEYPLLRLENCWTATRQLSKRGFPNFGPTFFRYTNGTTSLYALAKTWDRVSRETLKRIAHQPSLYVKHDRWLKRTARALEQETASATHINLRSLSTFELERMFMKLQDGVTAVHLSRIPGWVMEQRFERFSRHVITLLKRHIAARNLPHDSIATFAALSTPLTRVRANEEAGAVLRLAAIPGRVPQTRLEQHMRLYQPFTYGIIGPGLTLGELRRRIVEARRGDPRAEIRQRRVQQLVLARERRRLLRKLRLPARLSRLVGIAELIGYEKAWSKEIQFAGNFALDRLEREIGRRYGLTLRQVRWMLPEEVTDMLSTGKRPKGSELDARFRDSGLLVTHSGMAVLLGEQLKSFVRKNKLEEGVVANANVQELRGTPAFAGLARGAVRVIESSNEMNKMHRGDILVSHMTIPEIVPAMRIAGAIVTDIGGLTCHAAIVSRELSIPCIIGTKIATQVFKDGDVVEVDANKGIVKKLD